MSLIENRSFDVLLRIENGHTNPIGEPQRFRLLRGQLDRVARLRR
jgi:hypothetical protein